MPASDRGSLGRFPAATPPRATVNLGRGRVVLEHCQRRRPPGRRSRLGVRRRAYPAKRRWRPRFTSTMAPASATRPMRRSTRDDWLTEPKNPEPAYTEATRYVAASPKVQAAMAQAQKVQLQLAKPAVQAGLDQVERLRPEIEKLDTVAKTASAKVPLRVRRQIHEAQRLLEQRRAQNQALIEHQRRALSCRGARRRTVPRPRQRRPGCSARRGSRRGATTRTSSRDGDSGDSDLADSEEPPPGGRLPQYVAVERAPLEVAS
jgi:hypothetical protein